MTEARNNQVSSLASRYNLGESVEWQKLLGHFDLTAGGFAFIVLLVPDLDGAEICRNELEHYLASDGKTLWQIPLEKPDDLKLLASNLIDLKLPEATEAVWVSATIHQTLSEEEHWKAAWREGVAQLNQYRNPLRNHLGVTVIFAGAPWLQEVIREMAPDLWSVRTLVVSVSPTRTSETTIDFRQNGLGFNGSTLDSELALREAEKLIGQPGKELTLAKMLHRAGEGLIERNQWREAISLFEQSLDLRRRFHDSPENIGQTLVNLGRCLNAVSRNKEALVTFQDALNIFRRVGLRELEGRTLNALGGISLNLGRTEEAVGYSEQSLNIARQVRDHRGEANALGNLGIAFRRLGELRRATECYEQSLKLHQESGDRRGESADLSNLGIAYRKLGDPRKAIEFHERALAISQEINDRLGEGSDLGNLGIAYKDLGELHKAIEFYERRLVIAREIGDRRGEGSALGNLGIAYRLLGELQKSLEFHKQNLAIVREIGDRLAEGIAVQNIAETLEALGEHKQAIE